MNRSIQLLGARGAMLLALILTLGTNWFAHAGEKVKPVSRYLLRLRDGSLIVSSDIGTVLPVASETLGKLKLPIQQIRSIRFGAGNGVAEVVLENGDRFRGRLDQRSLRTRTSFGVFDIGLDLIVEVSAQHDLGTAKGLLLSLGFDQDEPGSINDASENRVVGATHNAGHEPHGKKGAAIRLTGDGSYLELPDSNLWAFGEQDFSIDLFVSFDSVADSDIGRPAVVFVANDERGGGANKWFFAWGGGRLNFHINSPAGPCVFLAQAPFEPEPRRWYHVAVTREQGQFTTYIDGAAVAEERGPRAMPNPYAPLTIGTAEGLGFIDGLLDEIHIWNRALTPAEIAALSAGQDLIPVQTAAPAGRPR